MKSLLLPQPSLLLFVHLFLFLYPLVLLKQSLLLLLQFPLAQDSSLRVAGRREISRNFLQQGQIYCLRIGWQARGKICACAFLVMMYGDQVHLSHLDFPLSQFPFSGHLQFSVSYLLQVLLAHSTLSLTTVETTEIGKQHIACRTRST